MKNYLITGGAGFIGSSLTEVLLNTQNNVIVIDNFCDFYDISIKKRNIENFLNKKNYKLYEADIRDYKKINEIFEENKIDIVIHLAGMAGVRNSIENPILYQEVNCIGTQNILEVMKKNNIKKGIFASSSSVYGNCKTVPFKENMIVDYAISPYAATKKSNEIMAHVYYKLYGIDIFMLRFFTVYGPKQRPDLAISKFTKLILENKPIPMFGDGTTSRDYTYISDIVDGIIKSIEYLKNNSNVYEVLNIGNSYPVKLKYMIDILVKKLNKKITIQNLPMKLGDVERTYADIEKAKKLIGYNPKVSFEEGIDRFIDWYKKFYNY